MRRLVMWLSVVLSLGLGACDDEGTPDGGGEDADTGGDADADVDYGPDADYPPLDCGDDEENGVSCMMAQPPTANPDGVMCGGECLPSCLLTYVCPEGWICHVAGVNGVCFPEE